ncbi:MAG TPA: acyltransferase [Deltaproteobacteria bacterium]|nr:acyltransferase [Deltaproteobacteria bacterium]HQJ07616.1 acyltransferase [Deltaproteobacteria bacterium]
MGKNHIYEFDVLRIIGALSVLMYHYTFRCTFVDGTRVPMFPAMEILTKYGYLGITAFFMISGFVILYSALDKTSIHFIVSRMDRLYPIYWIAVSLTVLSDVVSGESCTLYTYLMNLTMLNDYFNVPDVDRVYWTLHAELKFYFCVFMLILTGQVKRYHVWIPLWLALTVCYLLFRQPFFLAWFVNPFYSSYFISGILFYLIYTGEADWRHCAYLLLSCSVSAFTSIGQVEEFIPVPSLQDRAAAPIVVMLIYALFYLISKRKISVGGSRILLLLSSLTYPLFLLHDKIGKALFDRLSPLADTYIALIAVVLLIIALSFCVSKCAEQWYAFRWRRLAFSLLCARSIREIGKMPDASGGHAPAVQETLLESTAKVVSTGAKKT